MHRALWLATLLALVAPRASHAGEPQAIAPPILSKPHEALWKANRHLPVPRRAPRVAPGPLQPRAVTQPHAVFGYLPYWKLDYDDFRWDLLTHLAYFAVEIHADASLGDSHKFLDPSTSALIAEAHAHGVKVVLTATNFDTAQVGVILASPALRKKLIDGLLGMIAAQGADGVNMDFEFVPASAKADFVTFLAELTAAVHEAVPGGHVSIAGPAVDWSGAYDYDQVAANCDAIFIMAYGYHWSGGNPGPLCPLSQGAIWGKHTLPWTVADYVTYGGEGIRSKLIAGLPLYGYDWASLDPAVPGKAAAKGNSVTYIKALAEGPLHGWVWDMHSQTPYYMYEQGGVWHQVWADTAESLALKFDYTVSEQLLGVGFWALGYDQGDDAVWTELEERYPAAVVDPPPVDEGLDEQDAGSWDAGSWDAGSWDAGSWDAGSWDAGPVDSGSWDAGAWDSGAGDAITVAPDAGGPALDADGPGPWKDSAGSSGGTGSDDGGSFFIPGNGAAKPGGTQDASVLPGGEHAAVRSSAEGGCGATGGRPAPFVAALGLMLCMVALRRRA